MLSNITQVIACVEAHLVEMRGPEDIAARLGVSYETLRKTFRRERGLTLGRYLMQQRIARTKQLLCETDLLCFEITYEVGFFRDDHACAVFRREVGMSREQYRQHFGPSRR